MNKPNVLLTGAFGYIGSTFIDKYYDNYKITALDVNFFGVTESLKSKVNKTIFKDIRDISYEDLKDINIVIHMAELSNDPMGEINHNITKDINIEGTKKLINACNNSDISKFIYMSSCSVYGFNENLASEKSKLNPLTQYAKSKVENEQNLLNNDCEYEIKILRNATAFGYSLNHRLDLVVNDLLHSALVKKEIKVLSDGSPIRPIIHIRDICKTINHLIEEDKSTKLLFNVGYNSMNYTVKDIALMISNLTKVKNISFGESDGDKRSYKVDFSYFASLFPSLVVDYDLEKGVVDLINNYKTYTPKTQARRIDQLKLLVNKDIINEEFRYIHKT